METITIKQTVNTTTEFEKEISVPSFWNLGNCIYWKIISEDKAVKAMYTGFGASEISTDSPIGALVHEDIKECSKEEFEAAYNNALNEITALNSSI